MARTVVAIARTMSALLAVVAFGAVVAAERLPIRVYSVAEGLPHNVINRIVRDGQRSPALNLDGRGRTIKQIEVIARALGGPRHRALIDVYGQSSRGGRARRRWWRGSSR